MPLARLQLKNHQSSNPAKGDSHTDLDRQQAAGIQRVPISK
jgi:hypothetical protein